MESIVTQNNYSCFFDSHRKAECEHHLLFGRGIRPLAEEDGIKVPISNYRHNMGPVVERIHDNPMAEKLSKMLGQALWERYNCLPDESVEETRERFRRRYGQSFI